MLFTGNHGFVNHVYLQNPPNIQSFQQTSTHQPLLVKMSKSDVSVPSNDTGVELKEHLQVERCKGGFLLLRVMFESVLERYPTAAI